MKEQNIVIIGAGASGMFAAITAAKNNAKVILLEHTDKIGKKLLATGNGRCNLTNLSQSPNDYRSENQGFPSYIINQFDETKTLEAFREIGIYTKDKNGYVYPYSEQASSVLALLKSELERLNIEIRYEAEVKGIVKKGKQFQVNLKKEAIFCDSVIIAAGSMAAPKTGSDGSGYELAKSLGHHIIKPLPALVQLRCSGNYFKSLAGIRCEAKLSLSIDGQITASDRGELQLTDYGISGIPTFQISRYAIRALDKGREVTVLTDFMPDLSEEELNEFIQKQIKHTQDKQIEELLIGLFNKKLVPVLLKQAGISEKATYRSLKEKECNALIELIKSFPVKVTAFNTFEQAQVCSGGVDTREVSKDTLESLKMPGIYFAGEILDVDGICGGYNLQWAWSSGYVAGYCASRSKN
ncbi:BaiN/RdsA family NAD(P)/FAD-dependent oxidoreductase [Konateibacter massiliensis]|uniref:NAD(P)/FAD-dependent oxidoreductase n=1 Tax=Konateibacter massiliensis TaxID=2002841 RepID=UPI000C15D1F1|nr:NAD(P)/FAD-dependent oxidoreductase [Konateibacter massiliensis]